MGAERVRRPRGPRGGRVPEGDERAALRQRAGRRVGRRGVDGLAGRLAPDLRRRPRLRLQVEHGLDARHARLLQAGSGLPALPPPRADVRDALRLQRELHPAAEPRRGRARQGLAAEQDARRPLAAARQPARAVRLHVGAPGQAAAVHGRRARPGAGVEPRALARLAPARAGRARRRAGARARPQPRLPRRGRRCGRSTSSRPGSAWLEANDAERNVVAFARDGRADDGERARLRRQPLAGAARGLPRRAAARRRAGARCSTPTRPSYGGAGFGNRRRRASPRASPGTASRSRRSWSSRRSASCGSFRKGLARDDDVSMGAPPRRNAAGRRPRRVPRVGADGRATARPSDATERRRSRHAASELELRGERHPLAPEAGRLLVGDAAGRARRRLPLRARRRPAARPRLALAARGPARDRRGSSTPPGSRAAPAAPGRARSRRRSCSTSCTSAPSPPRAPSTPRSRTSPTSPSWASPRSS